MNFKCCKILWNIYGLDSSEIYLIINEPRIAILFCFHFGGEVLLGRIQALKFINPKCKVHHCVLGVSFAGSCIISTGIN